MTESLRVDGPVIGRSGDHTLYCTGTLDGRTYRALRDTVIDAALAEPTVVIVDVNALAVPAASAWSVFTSARWHVRVWPGVPIVLVCADPAIRDTLRRNGITRYVPAYRSVPEARSAWAADGCGPRRRASAELPAAALSAARARQLIGIWLTAWSRTAMIPGACTVASELVENALLHTDSAVALIVECDGDHMTVAVQDRQPGTGSAQGAPVPWRQPGVGAGRGGGVEPGMGVGADGIGQDGVGRVGSGERVVGTGGTRCVASGSGRRFVRRNR